MLVTRRLLCGFALSLLVAVSGAAGCRDRVEEAPVAEDPPPAPPGVDERKKLRDGVEGGGAAGSSVSAPGGAGSAIIDAGVIDAATAQAPPQR